LLIWALPVSAQAPSPNELAFRKAAADRYLQYTDAVRQQVLTPASCPFSPASIVLVEGNDPIKLAKWVRERIAYEPYAGSVRGAEGAMAARAGNDWDRALVLQALLEQAGYKSKLKVITRTPDQAAKVVDDFLKQPSVISSWFNSAPTTSAAQTAPSEKTSKLLQQFGAVPENRQLYDARASSRVQRIVDECLDAAAGQTPLLLQSLSSSKPGQPFDAWRNKLLAGAADRVDIELESIKGPQILSVAPEQAPSDPAQLKSAQTLDAPPPDKIAHFSVRLDMTPSQDGKPGEAVKLLDREFALGDLFHRPIRLEINPSDDAASAKPTSTWNQSDWFNFVSHFKNYQAILRIGQEWDGSKVFDTDGQIHTVSSDGRVEGATNVGGSVNRGFGGFGGLAGGGGAAKPKAKSGIDSLVLTLELSLPGEKPQVQQRLIYGHDHPGVTPVFTCDMLATSAPITPLASTWMLLDAVTRNAPLASRLVTTVDPRRFEQTQGSVRFPGLLYDWQMMRLAIADRMLDADKGITLLGGPSVVMHSTHLTIDQPAKKVASRHAMDVAFAQLMMLPRAADQLDAASSANTRFGVSATVLESALLRKIDPAHGTRGAYAIFDEAQAAGDKPVVVTSAANSADTIKPPPLVAWSLARNETGRTLIFPGDEAKRAWWSIDPATGLAIGRGDGGEGQSAMEYLQVTKKNLENLKCMVGFSQQMLSGQSRGAVASGWMMCETGTDNSGNGYGAPGAIEGYMDPDEKVLDLGIGPMADALGGAKDLYDLMNHDGPNLYTGRN
jgi:hypothetical protein